MPGPILLHCKKDIETYRYFGNQISKALDNKKISAFGTDGEKAMYKGLQETVSNNQITFCACCTIGKMLIASYRSSASKTMQTKF